MFLSSTLLEFSPQTCYHSEDNCKMKLCALFTSLELLCIIYSVRGGLRSLPVGTLEVDDPVEILYHNDSSHLQNLEWKGHDYEEKMVESHSPPHASAHRRQLGGDPLSRGISSSALRMSCNSNQRAVMISKSTVSILVFNSRLCSLKSVDFAKSLQPSRPIEKAMKRLGRSPKTVNRHQDIMGQIMGRITCHPQHIQAQFVLLLECTNLLSKV
jgi:hypothetical protein